MKCPPDFYTNCTNAQRKCSTCKAGSGKKGFYYEPIKDIGPHPYEARISKQPSTSNQYGRKGLKREKQTINSINKKFAKPTLGSGRINQDGDFTLGELKVEHKTRFKTGSIGISKKEYEKGVSQNIDMWLIKMHTPDNKKSFVVIDLETFITLVKHGL